ncbi:c-type cytochrome [Stappia sp. ES.058]|uniref:c-type cytochrome n=1 Tax=Stappia sp. ES.058 TaxID=1881061 RepID=UPI000B887879|nr:c-type cytochrome [Stappia sp. ES.058]
MTVALCGAAVAAGWPERLSGHGGPIKSVMLSRDERRALTTSFDYSVILWDIAEGHSRISRRMIGHNAAANDARFLPGGKRAVSVGDDGAVLLWDLADGSVLSRVDTGDDKMLSLAVSESGRFLAVASWDRSAHLFEVRDASLVPLRRLTGHRNNVNAVAFSPDEKVVFTGASDGVIRSFSRADGALLREVHVHGWGINVLQLMKGGRKIAFGATDGAVAVVDIESGEVSKQLANHDRPVLALTMTQDGALLASGGGDGQIRVYDAQAWTLLERYENPYGPVWGMALTGDHAVAFYAGLDDHVNTWQIAPRKPFEPVGSSFPRRFQVADTQDPGALQFARKCSVCHTLTPDDGNRAGPTLYGVFGREVGSLPGYPYSQALLDADFTWTEKTISDLFDHGPDVVTPGTKMPIQRLKSVEERNALVRFLKQATASDAAPHQDEKEIGK